MNEIEWRDQCIRDVAEGGFGITVVEEDMEIWAEDIEPALTIQLAGERMVSREVMWLSVGTGKKLWLARVRLK